MFDSKLVNKKFVSAQRIENKLSDILLSPCNLIDQKQLVCLAYLSVWNSPGASKAHQGILLTKTQAKLKKKCPFWIQILVCKPKVNSEF